MGIANWELRIAKWGLGNGGQFWGLMEWAALGLKFERKTQVKKI